MASVTFFSSIANVPNPNIPSRDVGFCKIRFPVRKNQSANRFHPRSPILIAEASRQCICSCTSPTVTNSSALDHDEELKSKSGSKVRVNVATKVYHVPKVPELDLRGRIGVFKQYIAVYEGKRISANLPSKVEFVVDEVLGRDGKPVKFAAHFKR